MTVPAVAGQGHNTKEVLVVPDKTNKSSQTQQWLTVISVDDFYSTIKAVHESIGHGGEQATEKKLRSQYDNIPRVAIQQFLKTCLTCQVNRNQKNEAPPRAIISQGLFSRCQIDLMCMNRKEFDGYHYIGHLMDHFSKFHFLFPLKRKTQEEVNENLKQIFALIGMPRILHSDNGSEFLGMQRILDSWPGNCCSIVHGRPRHPQSQGLVERGNRSVQEKLGALEAAWTGQGPAPWPSWLPVIQYQLNTTYTRTINMSPYECVFGVKPRLPPQGPEAGRVIEEVIDLDEPHREVVAEPPQGSEAGRVIEEVIDLDEPHREVVTEQPPDEAVPHTDHSYAMEDMEVDQDPGPDMTQRQQVLDSLDSPEVDNEVVDGTSLASQDRLTDVRQKANAAYLKSAAAMLRQSKKRKTTDDFVVGDNITLKIPCEDRHKADPRRLPGVVVDVRGQKDKAYVIRSAHGVIEGTFRQDSIQRFEGPLNFGPQNWEKASVIPLRTAARKQSSSSTEASKCGCKKGCSTKRQAEDTDEPQQTENIRNQPAVVEELQPPQISCTCKLGRAGCKSNSCMCRRHGIPCSALCHPRRKCSNAAVCPPEPEAQAREQPASLPAHLAPFVQGVIDECFSSQASAGLLEVLAMLGSSWHVLQQVAAALNSHLPKPPDSIVELPAVSLGRFGAGFIDHIPEALRDTHKAVKSPSTDNACLYASTAMLLWGSSRNAFGLKLASLISGITNFDQIVREVTTGCATTEAATVWASRATTDAVMQCTTQLPDSNSIVETVVKEELLRSFGPRDAAEVQLRALSCHLGRPIELFTQSPGVPQCQTVGQGSSTPIRLSLVPLEVPCTEGTRYSHIVPLCPLSPQELNDIQNECLAEQVGACQGCELSGWIQCDRCKRWIHDACLGYLTADVYNDSNVGLDCGCHKVHPLVVKSRANYTTRPLLKSIRDRRDELKDLMHNIVNSKMPSWRHRAWRSRSPRQVQGLKRDFVQAALEEKTVDAVKKYISGNLLARPVERDLLDLVLCPELLIYMASAKEGVNRMEAECVLREYHATLSETGPYRQRSDSLI